MVGLLAPENFVESPWIDRIPALFQALNVLSDQITVFAVSKPSACLYYKFKYAGNTQYHKIEYDLIDEISKLNAVMKDLISDQV